MNLILFIASAVFAATAVTITVRRRGRRLMLGIAAATWTIAALAYGVILVVQS